MNSQRITRKGTEKRSLNHATRYSLLPFNTFLVIASLVARVNAERSDRKTHECSICNININLIYLLIIVFTVIVFT
jgi:hypothetical protein